MRRCVMKRDDMRINYDAMCDRASRASTLSRLTNEFGVDTFVLGLIAPSNQYT